METWRQDKADYILYYSQRKKFAKKVKQLYLIWSWDDAYALVSEANLTYLKKAVKLITLACFIID